MKVQSFPGRWVAVAAVLLVCALTQTVEAQTAPKASPRVEALLAKMTVAEKVGQLNLIPGGKQKDLNSRLQGEGLEAVRRGEAGAYLHVAGAERLREIQRIAVEESRLKSPLLFAMDVVHGYRTIFPVPLSLAASWDPQVAESAARVAGREATRRSIVLLKNEGAILPLKPGLKRIAVVGELAGDANSQLGSWRGRGEVKEVVGLREGLRARAGSGVVVDYVPGARPRSDSTGGIPDAVRAAQTADLVVMVLGEDFDLSGEARSRSSVALPGAQLALAEAVFATGKPVVAVLTNGRPLAVPQIDAKAGVPGAPASGKSHEVPRRLRSRRETAAISGPSSECGAEAARGERGARGRGKGGAEEGADGALGWGRTAAPYLRAGRLGQCRVWRQAEGVGGP